MTLRRRALPFRAPSRCQTEGEGRRGFLTGLQGERRLRPPVAEEPSHEHQPSVRKIPLNQLILSPTNVRKTPPSAAEDAELKASIRARGLKQNLVVHPSADEKGVHDVTAGGRRLKALQELAAEGVIPADYKVPCLVESGGRGARDLADGKHIRAAMHPADEFVAMAALIDAGAPIEAVAARFGVPEQRVKQRLRLGKLAPELLDAYRDGAISLEIMMAFTLGADHAAQLAVWHQVKDQHYLSAHSVRRLLTDSAVPLDSDLGAFVGSPLTRPPAARSRAISSAARTKASWTMPRWCAGSRSRSWRRRPRNCAAQWAWAKPVLDPDYGFRRAIRRVEPLPAELPPEIAAELERIEERLARNRGTRRGRLARRGDDRSGPARGTPRRADRNDRGPRRLAREDRAIAGCIVTIGDDGEFLISMGSRRPLGDRSGADAADPAATMTSRGASAARRRRRNGRPGP